MPTPKSPRGRRPDPIWGRYSPASLTFFGAFSALLLVVIIASWLPPYEIPGVPYYEQPVQFLPSGVGIGFMIITGRQLYLWRQSRKPNPALSLSESGESPVRESEVSYSSDPSPTHDLLTESHPPFHQDPHRSAQLDDDEHTEATGGRIRWPLITVIVVAITLAVIGFSRGYDHEVVVQEAQEEVTREVSTGSFRVLETSERICGVGEDFQFCLGQHIAVYNANCAERQLDVFSEVKCNELLKFIDGARSTLEGCGFGCTTTSENNLWGWGYLRTEPALMTETVQEARDEVRETKRCNFDLGPITFGDCRSAS